MISLIGDEKLTASEAAGKRKIPWKQMTAVAACAVVLLSSAFVYAKLRTSKPEKPGNPVIEMPSDSPAELRILSTSATTYYSSSLIANDTDPNGERFKGKIGRVYISGAPGGLYD